MTPCHAIVFGLLSGCLVVGCNRGRSNEHRRTEPPSIVPGQDVPLPPARSATEAVPVPPDPMKEADADMARVLAELASLGGKPLDTLSAAEARQQPTPTDAVKSLLQKQGKTVEPEAVAKVQERSVPNKDGAIPVRVYTPAGKGPMPLIVYYHGGGFVIGSNDVYDATPRALANGAQAVVVSVEYRKAPEHKFPAAHDDAFAAYRWVVKNAAALGGDVKRLAVAGESAGGNLAENVAIMARDQQERSPEHVLLVYPVASANVSSESYDKYRDAKPLNKAMMIWFTQQYFRGPADAQDPRMDLANAKLVGLPTTTIINAELDPLLSDGELLAQKLEAAGVSVEQKTFAGVTHEFFGMGEAVGDATAAVELACERLKSSFEAAAQRVETAAASKP